MNVSFPLHIPAIYNNIIRLYKQEANLSHAYTHAQNGGMPDQQDVILNLSSCLGFHGE